MKKMTSLLMAVVGLPFLMLLVKFFKSGPDEPMTVKDGLVLFGIQLAVVVAFLVYLTFFYHPVAMLG